MRGWILPVGVLLFGLLPAATPTVAIGDEGGDVRAGHVMATQCLACHGPRGEGAGAMPPLRGLSEEQLFAAMETFARGNGDNVTIMDRHAPGYTEQQKRAIARALADMLADPREP